MPVVEVNGQELEFPDDMGHDAIKAVLQKKFPQPQQSNMMNDAESILGRTGRIATGIAGGVADLPVTVAQSAYDTVRGLQSASNKMGYGANLPGQVAPEYKIPLPSEALKGVYDIATNNAGKATGDAASIDKAAEFIAPLTATATKIIPEIAKAIIPRAQGVTKQLAQRAQELNIPLRVDQIAPSRAMNTAQKISQEIPLSGVDASEANQTLAWNKALAKTLGQDADNLSPEVIQQFRKDASTKFGDILTGRNIAIDNSDVAKIKNISQIAPNSLGADSLSVVNSNIKQALRDIKTGNMTGEKLANIRSYFLNNAADAEGGAKKFIGKIVDRIDDIAAKNMPEEQVQALQTARKEWRNYRTIEPLLEKSIDGNINPVELLNRVKDSKYIKASQKKIGEDDLIDLARIGKQFLVKKGGSDTFQKMLGAGSLAGMVANPALALQSAAVGGGVMAANRGLQAANNSQALIRTALTDRNFNPNLSKLLTILTANAAGQSGD